MFVPAGTDRTLGCHASNINPTRVYELCLCSTTVMGSEPELVLDSEQACSKSSGWQHCCRRRSPTRLPKICAEDGTMARHDGLQVQRCTCRAAQHFGQRSQLAALTARKAQICMRLRAVNALRSEEWPQYPSVDRIWQPLLRVVVFVWSVAQPNAAHMLQGTGSHRPLWQRLFSCVTRQQHPDGVTSVNLGCRDCAVKGVTTQTVSKSVCNSHS